MEKYRYSNKIVNLVKYFLDERGIKNETQKNEVLCGF